MENRDNFDVESGQLTSPGMGNVVDKIKSAGILVLNFVGIGRYSLKEIKQIMDHEFRGIPKITGIAQYKESNPDFVYNNLFEFEGDFFDFPKEKQQAFIDYLVWRLDKFKEALMFLGDRIKIEERYFVKHEIDRICRNIDTQVDGIKTAKKPYTNMLDRNYLENLNRNPYVAAYNKIMVLLQLQKPIPGDTENQYL